MDNLDQQEMRADHGGSSRNTTGPVHLTKPLYRLCHMPSMVRTALKMRSITTCDRLLATKGRYEDRERFAHPVPRIREALWLAEQGAASAIDISDGLSSDLCHIAVASRVTMKIDLAAIPLVDGVTAEDAARSGEEYEIVVTSAVEIDIGEFERRFNLDLTRIGSVERGETGVEFFQDGSRIEVQRGYLHFE